MMDKYNELNFLNVFKMTFLFFKNSPKAVWRIFLYRLFYTNIIAFLIAIILIIFVVIVFIASFLALSYLSTNFSVDYKILQISPFVLVLGLTFVTIVAFINADQVIEASIFYQEAYQAQKRSMFSNIFKVFWRYFSKIAWLWFLVILIPLPFIFIHYIAYLVVLVLTTIAVLIYSLLKFWSLGFLPYAICLEDDNLYDKTNQGLTSLLAALPRALFAYVTLVTVAIQLVIFTPFELLIGNDFSYVPALAFNFLNGFSLLNIVINLLVIFVSGFIGIFLTIFFDILIRKDSKTLSHSAKSSQIVMILITLSICLFALSLKVNGIEEQVNSPSVETKKNFNIFTMEHLLTSCQKKEGISFFIVKMIMSKSNLDDETVSAICIRAVQKRIKAKESE